jgi:hypothetical protein
MEEIHTFRKITVNMSSRRTTDGRDIFKVQGLKSFTVLVGSIRAKHVDIDIRISSAVRQAYGNTTGRPEDQARDASSSVMREEHWAGAHEPWERSASRFVLRRTVSAAGMEVG